MASKTYEQRVARLVQDATGETYTTCLRWTSAHMREHPERMDRNERALAVVNAHPETP
jgi:hypothetical protein